MTLSELDEFFRERRADLFIDQSEMLDSRLVAGDPKMSWRFAKRIMAPHVYGRRDTYCAAMVEELTARHADEATSSDVIAIKEGRGGLRDINMLLLTLKAAHGVKAPLAAEVWAALAESADDEKIRAALGQLEGHYRFLRRVRDLYRLSVAYEETVSPAHLSDLLDIAPLEVMGDDPDALATRTREHMAGAHDCIQRVLRATQLV